MAGRRGLPMLVDALTLSKHISNCVILDATWTMAAGARASSKGTLPNAMFFDLDAHSDRTSSYPHMLPSQQAFHKTCHALGVHTNSTVVVYDGSVPFHLRPSCRVWWTFVTMGFPKSQISVLDGGLDAWLQLPLDLRKAADSQGASGGDDLFVPKVQEKHVVQYEQVQTLIQNGEGVVVDARPKGRFDGTEPEPRPGLKSGHMRDAISIPSSTLFDSETGKFKSIDELKMIFTALTCGGTNKSVVASCGSGVTAAVLAFAIEHAGVQQNVPVYDGSWTEWVSRGGEIV